MSSEIQDLAPQMPTPYLRRFFEEKDLPEVNWVLYDINGNEHHISNVVVVEHMTMMGKKEAKQVENVLRKLDFHNADINDFLKHLAGAVINMGVAASEVAENPAAVDPVVRTAAGAGLGSLAGVILGSFVGGPGLGSIVGGALGGYAAAPEDRKSRGAWGGGIGGALTPIGAVAGGAIAGRKPSKVRPKNNPSLPTTTELVSKLKF